MATTIAGHVPSSAGAVPITVTTDDVGVLTIRLRGRLDAGDDARLRTALSQPSPTASVLLDLAGATITATALIAELLAFVTRLRTSGGRVAILASEQLTRALTPVRCDQAYSVEVRGLS